MTKLSGSTSDEDLMARIANGDRAAIQSLFARYHARVFRFIVRQIGTETVAEELANEVFLDAWRQAGKFEGRSAVSTWLMAMARNKAISSLRKRRDAPLDDEQASQIADEADTPEANIQKLDKAVALRQAIDQLSVDHKAVIDLVYYHEMSVSEVAEVLDIPLNTVKTRMFHARKRLHDILEQAGVDRGWP